MFEHFESERDVYGYRLGAALTMEHEWITLIATLIESVDSDDVTDFLELRAAESRQQIAHLDGLFEVLEFAPAEYPSPIAKAITVSESAFLSKCAPVVRETAALASALAFVAAKVANYVILLGTTPGESNPLVRATLENSLTLEIAAYEELQLLLSARDVSARDVRQDVPQQLSSTDQQE